jgi:cupin superfamily acireductone dioxygenase involved in methionine salvage
MAKPKFSKSDLSLQAAQVKRTIISRAEKGIYLDKSVSKTETLKMIAKNLKLSSHRSLYDNGEREQYINNWFQKLETEIDEINNNLNNFSESNVNQEKYKSVGELLNLLEEERKIRRAYEQRIQNLMQENESLRVANLNRFKKIDEL